MMEKMINSYVNKLTKNDIIKFADKNNITLTNDEIDIIFNTIKKDWQDLLHNPNKVFNNIKSKVSLNTYNNIIYFYDLYSKKLYLR